MLKIPNKIEKNIKEITDALLNYDNTDNLSWLEVYKKILNKLNIQDNSTILSNTVREITNRGYIIQGYPFKLEKY